jgi:hypothetical protein
LRDRSRNLEFSGQHFRKIRTVGGAAVAKSPLDHAPTDQEHSGKLCGIAADTPDAVPENDAFNNRPEENFPAKQLTERATPQSKGLIKTLLRVVNALQLFEAALVEQSSQGSRLAHVDQHNPDAVDFKVRANLRDVFECLPAKETPRMPEKYEQNRTGLTQFR